MDVVERCYEYLSNGGLFNPELMDHEAVSNLVIDCRNEIERLRQQNERMKKTLQNIALVLDEENPDYQKWALYCGDIASLCLENIAKATGGE